MSSSQNIQLHISFFVSISGTATAEITVLDSNNVIPSFGQAKYVFTILESADPRTVVETIMAEDTDTTASIVYRIRDGSVTGIICHNMLTVDHKDNARQCNWLSYLV